MNSNDLPGIDELKAAGLLDARPAAALTDMVDNAGASEAGEGEADSSEDDAAPFEPDLDGADDAVTRG